MKKRKSILIVDDEQSFLNSVMRKLRLEGYSNLEAVCDPLKVPGLIEKRTFDAAFLDITMPGMDGLELLELIKTNSPATQCIMVTANENIPLVIKAVKIGAYDYLVKPITPDQLIHSLERALAHKYLHDVLLLKQEQAVSANFQNPDAFQGIVTGNDKMLRVLHEAELHAQSDIVVLITGETGVGKELLARAIHKASERKASPFIAVNMLSIASNLFEAELFGYKKGAFTGADRDKQGYLAQAAGGSLFLDEIGDLAIESQGKLLRLLQESEYTPVGHARAEAANIRFVAATNQNLEKLIRQGKFRKDLFYRLQFAFLRLPPLRERKDDIPLLTAHFLKQSKQPGVQVSDKARNMLLNHDWPGNIRELKGVLDAAVNLAESGVIKPQHLNIPRKNIHTHSSNNNNTESEVETLAEVEKRHILYVYKRMGHNKTQTARELGIGLATLQRKLKTYRVR